MTEFDALMAAVLRSLEDDLPRLVYADWLEEHEEPERAEFIRVQCDLARLAKLVFDEPAIHDRERALFTQHAAVWWPGEAVTLTTPELPLSDTIRTQLPVLVVRRGFPEQVFVTMAAWCGGNCPESGCGNPAIGWNGFHRCSTCRGAGTLPGVGPACVAKYPLTGVRFVDREPDTIADAVCWVKGRPRLAEDRGIVPAELFDLLEGGEKESAGADWAERFGAEDEWCIYPTSAVAHTALGVAGLEWARSKSSVGVAP